MYHLYKIPVTVSNHSSPSFGDKGSVSDSVYNLSISVSITEMLFVIAKSADSLLLVSVLIDRARSEYPCCLLNSSKEIASDKLLNKAERPVIDSIGC